MRERAGSLRKVSIEHMCGKIIAEREQHGRVTTFNKLTSLYISRVISALAIFFINLSQLHYDQDLFYSEFQFHLITFQATYIKHGQQTRTITLRLASSHLPPNFPPHVTSSRTHPRHPQLLGPEIPPQARVGIAPFIAIFLCAFLIIKLRCASNFTL